MLKLITLNVVTTLDLESGEFSRLPAAKGVINILLSSPVPEAYQLSIEERQG
jgi:hypothetical protein